MSDDLQKQKRVLLFWVWIEMKSLHPTQAKSIRIGSLHPTVPAGTRSAQSVAYCKISLLLCASFWQTMLPYRTRAVTLIVSEQLLRENTLTDRYTHIHTHTHKNWPHIPHDLLPISGQLSIVKVLHPVNTFVVIWTADVGEQCEGYVTRDSTTLTHTTEVAASR